jgi:glycosyltransferase involved in cell wall biosynthesis
MRVDIVIPAHNEEGRIGSTLDAYLSHPTSHEVRFTVALDRCTDRTEEVVGAHAAAAGESARVQTVSYPKLGKGGVLMEAFRACDGEMVGFVDADGATPPAELMRLVEATAAGADGAIASRRHPAAVLPARRGLKRGLASAGFAFGVRRLFGLPYADTQCGAKVFRRGALERMLPLLTSRDFLIDVDLLYVAERLGLRVASVPTIWIDRAGSRVSAGTDTLRMAASALRLWLHHRVIPVEAGGAEPEAEAASPPAAPARRRVRRRPRPDVALVTPYPPAGARHAGRSGVASYGANLARALAAEGLRVTVVAPQEESGGPQVEDDGPVRVERRFQRGPAALPAAARAAVATRAPVVHLQHEFFLYGGPSSIPGLAPALGLLRGSGVGPVVTMHHAVDPASVDRGFVDMHRVRAPRWLARAGLGSVQRTIGSLSRQVIVHERAFAELVPGATVVPHGLEAAAPGEPAASVPGEEGAKPLTALCFGFLAPYKGLELALEAAARSPDSVQLVIAGDEHPRLRESGERYVERLRERWPGVAHFTGYVEDDELPSWFAAADVALFLYQRPFATSGALALALARETPVLLSPALARIVGAPAELVAADGSEGLAGQLELLARESGERDRLRAAGRLLAGDRSWATVARRHAEIYEEVSHADGARRGPLQLA